MRSPLALALLVGCVATADPTAGIAPRTPDPEALANLSFLPGKNEGATLEITVDGTKTETGWLTVSERLTHTSGSEPLYFKEMGASPEHEYRNVRAFGPKGEVRLERKKGRYIAEKFDGDTIEVRYEVKPGGLGRHGHQGLLREDWAAFDGRIYLQPRGAMGLSEIRIKFDLPEGWAAHTPFRLDGEGWLNLDVVPDRVQFEALQTSCVAIGQFAHDDRKYGDTEFRVAAYGGFSAEHKALLFEKTHRMATWFHDKLGFNPGLPFHFVWLPMPTKDRVFGGAWANGACFEQPDDRLRNWELVGHRLAHPINKYNPSGMTLRDHRDHWFMEGWASYIELVATAETGIADADQRSWNRMYNWYQQQRTLHPSFERSLATEQEARGDAAEFLHYVKGPLVVKLLDEAIRARTDKTMESFFAHLYAKYGGQKAPVPLREELEAFTGTSFDDFWAAHVDQAGGIVPIWSAYERARPAAEAAMKEPPMAMVGSRAIHPAFLHYLAATGSFERFEEVERWLEAAVARRAELDRRGVRLWPSWLTELEYGLPPAAQWSMMEAALAWPLDGAPPAPASSGCGGGGEVAASPEAAPFTLIEAHPSAAIWSQLRATEEAYAASLIHTGLEAIQAHRPFSPGDPPVAQPLAFAPGDRWIGMSVWLLPPDLVEFDLVVDGQVSMNRREVEAEPGWHRTWLTMEEEHRPAGEKLVLMRIYADGEPTAERAFWQREAPVDVE